MRTPCVPLLAGGLLALAGSARVQGETVLPSTSWRNTLSLPADPFRAQGYESEDPGWIKFLIFKSDLTRVYFQNSVHYPFHYDFAHELIVEYQGYTRQQFDQLTLHPADQVAVLGAVILPHWISGTPPEDEIREYGLQFVGLEPYEPNFIIGLFDLVKNSITAPAGTQALYFPAFEQQAAADVNRALFEAHGIEISSSARWSTQNVIYAPGWALGSLKFFVAADITPAYHSGQLLAGDILLTDGVPAEVPMVAGIISLVPSTPNSHVAILSNTFGIPFVYLSAPEDVARAQQLIGQRVALRALKRARYGDALISNLVRLLDAETLTAEQFDELLALKTPPPLDIQPMAPYGAYSAPALNLQPTDIRYFGGKAANFGMIRRSIPNNSPVAAAFSFDAWNAFLDQTLASGRTLRQTIRDRLAPHTYPPDIVALSADLADLRDLIEDDTSFSPELQAAIVATLQDPQHGFDPHRNIRFRSSTNVEDTEEFSGAGMYDSFSGCLADDLDGDTAGPSLCDPTETRERGVFRAIRKVYASFYNENACLERLRRHINEDQVGMGLLVHHSYPDVDELANGVATYEKYSPSTARVTLVTQKGAVSVTNPPAGSIPEEVRATVYTGSASIFPSVVTHSNLVPLGGTVLAWDSEYKSLIGLLKTVAATFEVTTGRSTFVLDFEYKKVAPTGRLEIKQVRELATPDSTPDTVPFLLGEPTDYCVFQGEYGDVFSNHRLKSQWRLHPRNEWLSVENLQACVYSGDQVTLLQDGAPRTLTGSPAEWPWASHSHVTNATTDSFRLLGAENPTVLALITPNIGRLVADDFGPLVFMGDFGVLTLQADYLKPVPIVPTYDGRTTTVSETVWLERCPRPAPDDRLVERTLQSGKVAIVTRFYWPKPSAGIVAGYTAPLARWDATTITGLTADPIVLHSPLAQTYRPEHHNFSEHFLFEPELEDTLPAGQRAELRAKNIRLIHAFTGGPAITTYGFLTPGDFNHDERVNATDLQHFLSCRTGPAIPTDQVTCADADLDGDADIDQSDFALFQACYSGSKPADPKCLAP